MQTILGSGGAIGIELGKALPQYTEEIRLVSRNPQKVNPGDELMAADLLQPGSVEKAIKGSSVVYVTIGFPYNIKFWQTHWIQFMEEVTETCIKEKCRLVFFDNVYMYDPEFMGNMTEETLMNPTSRKGMIRKGIVDLIFKKVKAGELTALIARSADFYGPGMGNTSMLNETVLKPLHAGKTANWMGKATFKHSFTYTPDAGKATAILGNTAGAYNQIWHLPTAANPMTGKELIEFCAKEMGVKPAWRELSAFMLKLLGIFIPIMREMPEMLYQYDRDYIFRSDKFEREFKFSPTPFEEGLREVIRSEFANQTNQ